MLAKRILCLHGVFNDTMKAVDSVAHKCEIDLGPLGATVKRPGHGTILVPWTTIVFATIEYAAKPEAAKVKGAA